MKLEKTNEVKIYKNHLATDIKAIAGKDAENPRPTTGNKSYLVAPLAAPEYPD